MPDARLVAGGLALRFDALLEVDEDVQMVANQLGRSETPSRALIEPLVQTSTVSLS